MTDDLESQLARAIREYDENGATVLRQVVPLDKVQALGEAVDAMMAAGEHGNDDRSSGGRFFRDLYSTITQPAFAEFMRNSGLAAIAGKIMRASEVRFFYDQLLVKEPGTAARTPWHQDLPYWPFRGEQVLSTWVPMDAATPENGVVTYVKGSHMWNKFFPIQPFSEVPGAEPEPWTPDSPYDRPDGPGRTLADVRNHPENYEFLTWNVEPGDILVHHPLVVHGAPGNEATGKRRRALSLRWLGDDATWDNSRPNFMRMICKRENLPFPDLAQGSKVSYCEPFFPLMWSAASATGVD